MRKIIADSSCDITTLDRQYNNVSFSTVPLSITIENKSYLDDTTLNIEEMMYHMESTKEKTSSACPSPDYWIKESKDANEIFMVPMTSALSGSFNSAVLAKEMILEKEPDKKIYVLDTLSTSGANALIIYKLASLLETTLSFEKICEEIDKYKSKLKLNFILFSINNLVKNGRVNKLAGMAISKLNISLIGEASKEGTLNPLYKARGQNKSIELIIQEMLSNGFKNGKVVISHCFNETGAKKLMEKIKETFGDCKVSIKKASGLVSYYAERNGLLIGYEIGC